MSEWDIEKVRRWVEDAATLGNTQLIALNAETAGAMFGVLFTRIAELEAGKIPGKVETVPVNKRRRRRR